MSLFDAIGKKSLLIGLVKKVQKCHSDPFGGAQGRLREESEINRIMSEANNTLIAPTVGFADFSPEESGEK